MCTHGVTHTSTRLMFTPTRVNALMHAVMQLMLLKLQCAPVPPASRHSAPLSCPLKVEKKSLLTTFLPPVQVRHVQVSIGNKEMSFLSSSLSPHAMGTLPSDSNQK